MARATKTQRAIPLHPCQDPPSLHPSLPPFLALVFIKKRDHAIESVVSADDRQSFLINKRTDIRVFRKGAGDVVNVAHDGTEQLLVPHYSSAGVDKLALNAICFVRVVCERKVRKMSEKMKT